ncbi:MAG: AarF/UbiB family protein [bacterium]
MGRWSQLPGQVARASEIATVLWSSGFRWLVAALGLRSCVSAGCRLFCAMRLRQCEHHVGMERPLPDRMRLVLERLGPTFVKVGQVVALRPDYVPLEYAQALRRLHDHVAPFPGREARRVVEEELGRPLGSVFAEFEEEPFAAASLSQVDRERTTARVLTMELIEGTPPAPGAGLRAAGLDPDRLLRVGAEALVEQLFRIGLFHADPHPGNVLFLPGDRVCFLDFGMFGRLRPRERRRAGYIVWALASGDFDAVADQLLAFAQLGPGARPDGFREALEEVVEDWYAGAEAGGSVAQLLLRELALGARYGVIFPPELMLVARSLVGIDATTTLVAPGVSFSELLEPATDKLRRALLPSLEGLKEGAERRRFDYLEAALELPDLIPELVARLRSPPPSPAVDGQTPIRRRSGVALTAALLASAAAGFGIAQATGRGGR